MVQPTGQAAHVVRGTSRKKEHMFDVSEAENPDGSVKKTTTIMERIELVIRTIDQTGQIRTFMDANGEEPDST